MRLKEYAAITQASAPRFVEDGGEIEYELVLDAKGHEAFLIFGRRPDGTRIKCIVINSGMQKFLKSLPSLRSFHLTCYPDCDTLTIPMQVNNELMKETAA